MSQDLNEVKLIGRLGRDVEVRYTPSGTPVATLAVATNRSWAKKDANGKPVMVKVEGSEQLQPAYEQAVEWHRVELWKAAALNAKKYLKKGSRVFVSGRIQYDVVGDAPADGKADERKWFTKIVSQKVIYLSDAASTSSFPHVNEDANGSEIEMTGDEEM